MINYKYFFNNFDKAVILSEKESGRIIDINEKALALFCKSTDDFVNLKRTDILPLKAIQNLNLQLKKSATNSNFASADSFIIHKKGDKIPINIETGLLKENGTELFLEVISEKKNEKIPKDEFTLVEQPIDESENKYKTLFDNASDAIFLIKDESVVDCNVKALEIFRCSKEDILYKTPYDLSPEFQPDGSRSTEKTKEKIESANTEPQFFEWKHKRPDNSLFDAEVSINSVILNGENYIQAIVRDVTKKKQAELALIESKISLSSLLKNLPGAAYRCRNDKNWTMEFISEGCLELTGYTSGQLVNNNTISYADLIHPDDREMVWKKIQDAIKEKKSFQLVYRLITSNNKIKWVWEQGNGIFSTNNELLSLEGLINDITEQKMIEEALLLSETKFRSLVEEALVGVYIIQDGKFPYINPRSAEIFGYTVDEILSSLSLSDVIYEEDLELVQGNINKRISGEVKTLHYCFRGKKKDNTLIDLEVMGSFTIYDGRPAIIGTLLDVTKRKKSEKELIKLSRAVEQSPASIIITDTNGNIEYVNPKFSELTGYSFDEVIGKNPKFLKHGNYPEAFYKELWETIKAGQEWRGEFHNKKKTGESFWESASISPVKDSEGKITNFLAVKEDITERKKTDNELRKLSRAVEQNSASIIITNTDWLIEYVNPKFIESSGYSADEVIGKKPNFLENIESSSAHYENFWETLLLGDEWHGEFLNKKKDGENFWELASISSIKNSEGATTHYLIIKEDITQRKKAEEELKSAKEKAEEMNKLKSVFLANMSHELRTPMVAILGYSDILRKELENPNLQEMSNEIYDSSRRLMNTLNLLLDLSKIEANKEIIKYLEIDVDAIASEEFRIYEGLAKKKNLFFKIDLPTQPVVTLLDERMLRQIINNLASNAVKFTDAGGVTLTIKKETDNDRENVVIRVSDTGIGIPKSAQKLIFEAFRQISEGLNRKFEGTGLGLTITKKFVEMMNGEIEIESEPGNGSTFTVRFPILRRDDVNRINKVDSDPSQIQIEFPTEKAKNKLQKLLLIEDDQSNAGVIKFFLEGLYDIDIVSTGEDGIDMVKVKKYKAILMDIDLGIGMSGLETAKKIRNLPNYSNEPIIAVTALALRGDRERFLAEGCTHYIAKPFKKEELINTIKDALEISA